MSLNTPLIDAASLAALAPGDVLIVDCRFDLADPAKGERDYMDGHIPGAIYASLDRDLSDLSRQAEGLGRHPLPLVAALSHALSRWGWQPGMRVVSYDAAGGALAAARLWWLLGLVGETRAAVLDGGFAAWQAAKRPIETGKGAKQAAHPVSLRYDARQLLLEHQALLQSGSDVLLDARAAPRYRGDVEPLDRVAGHIPGALNRPFTDNLGSDGCFKPAALLRDEFVTVIGSIDPARVVHMCGSGVTACHNMLAMEVAGLKGSRLYAPSWSGWISDPARPVALGQVDAAAR